MSVDKFKVEEFNKDPAFRREPRDRFTPDANPYFSGEERKLHGQNQYPLSATERVYELESIVKDLGCRVLYLESFLGLK